MGSGASKRVTLEGKTTEQARAEASAQVQQLVSGYDSDVDNELGYKYAGRRELQAVAGGSGQGLAEKPWFGAIHAPSSWEEVDSEPPTDSLLLEWAYGYRGYDSRDNLYYTASGEIVYVTAGIGVVYDPSANRQRFYFDHTDDILCLAPHPSGSLVATGQVGVDPKICLWDTNSMSTIAIIHKCHTRGVAAIAISPDGKRVASIGLDQENTIVLHELNGENVNMVVSQKGGNNKLYVIKFNPTNANQFIAVGINTVKFCTFENASLQVKNGLFGTKGPQNILSLCYITVGGQSVVITGSERGEIMKWHNNAIQSSIAAHQGPVFSLFADGETIVSGGKDGKVLLLNAKLEVTKSFDLREIANNIVDSLGRSLIYVSAKAPPIKSVCRERGKILVGTANCEVIEIDEATSSGKLIVQGHSSGELWGLAVHPSKDMFVTGCDDKTVRVWSSQDKKMIGMRKVNGEARSVAYNHDGSLIAVGCLNGSLSVLESETLKEVFSTTIRKEEISEVKFSPDGKFLAMGSHDNFIDVFDVGRSFKLIGTCKGHASFIIHFDWSSDSRFIQSNCGAYELLFWDARGQEQITRSSDLRDVDWKTWTCILGWPVQGIWQKEAKGTDVNSSDRSHLGDLLVTADDFGMVNLFKYPAPKVGSHYKRYPGHSAHVTCARFTFNDKRVISTGGNDKTILQWRKVDESQKILPQDEELEDPIVVKELENTNYDKNRSMKEKVKLVAVKNEPLDSMEVKFERAARPPPKSDGKDTSSSSSSVAVSALARSWFAGNHPWLGSIYPPTNVAPSDGALPKESLQLEYVYGYRAHDARDNLFSLNTGEIIYSAAGVAVIHNTTNNTQRIFSEHSDDIVSLTVAPDGQTVATGQVGRDPTIIVWDSTTLKVLSILKATAQRAITSLGFSPDGVRLASVGLDDQHTLTVWDWKNQAIQAQAPGHTDKIFSVDFNPFDESSIVTCGVKHIKFWTLKGKILENRKGIFGQTADIQNIHSTAFLSPFLTIAGSQSGQLLKFEKNVLKESFPLHNKPITALHSNKTGIITADSDGNIKLWTHEFKPYKDTTFDLTSFTKNNTAYGSDIRSIRWIGAKIIVGTESSEVFEIDVASKAIKIINNGHSGGETWGLAAHPTLPRFVTASEDGTVRMWNIEERRLLAIRRLDVAVSAIAFSPKGDTIAVGSVDGHVIFLNGQDFSEKGKKKERVERVSDIKFSPDGTLVAVGTHDNFIDIYSSDSFKREAVCKGHSSFITHLDWSSDSKWIQSNCGAYELLFWNAAGVQQKQPSLLRDVTWHTSSCVLGWPVQGIWPRGADGTDINAVFASSDKKLLVSGDDFGTVKLFNYPATTPKAQYKAYHGHSAHVTNVVFSANNQYIITTGGADRSILQWKVQK